MVAGVSALALLTAGCASGQRGVPASEGLANFGRVSPALWRGAQPDERGLATLKKLGVATIINLRMAADVAPGEEAAARRLGLGYVSVPLPGWSAPDAAAVARVLSLLASAPAPVFLHCQHGADRTGTIVACYRIRHDGWTAERALAEAQAYGLSGWQFGMKRFVRNFRAR
ncbi:MAG: tyrosine-protein phosphatase [bacterium]|nr:tyrosine-protein phosphatase [bacterium]